MKAINWKFDIKSLVVGILSSAVILLLLDGRLGQAQRIRPDPASSVVSPSQLPDPNRLGYQITAGDGGIYILNVTSGKAVYRTKDECDPVHAINRCWGLDGRGSL